MGRYSWAAVVAMLVLGLTVAAAPAANATATNYFGGEDHTLTARHSGKCLNREYTLWFRGVKVFNSNDGAGVVQSACTGVGAPAQICINPSGCTATNQVWQLYLTGISGPIKLRNKQSGKCLDVAGGSILNYASVV
jgi:Ricin-type beta-trefoil lectin domain-like